MKLIIHDQDTCPSCDRAMTTIFWFKKGMTSTALHANGPNKWTEWAIKIVAVCSNAECRYEEHKK